MSSISGKKGERVKRYSHILVTDPCYIISDADWDKLLAKADKMPNWNDTFDNLVSDFLKKISGDIKAVAGSTGYGDWVNEIDNQEFASDSGMVCVVEETEKLQKYLDDNKVMFGFGCVARLDKPATKYLLDPSNLDWTVVKIYNGEKEIARSLPPEDEPIIL